MAKIEQQRKASWWVKKVVGMHIADARDALNNAGVTYRVVEQDGVAGIVTADCRFDRVNLKAASQKVTDAYIG